MVQLNQQGGLYKVDTWMVDGKPGTGNTPIEKLLALIFALWYIASIFPVIAAYIYGSRSGKRVAILGPLFYHIAISINGFLFLDDVCNPEATSATQIAVIHAVLAIVCFIIFKS